MVDWKNQTIELLERAINCLEYANIPFGRWSLGGGTALMFHYWHRESKGIDIFLSNAQHLTALSPRLNNYTKEMCTDYRETSNSVRLVLGEKEINFIVAPNLSGWKPVEVEIESINLLLEQPEEILAKKFYYYTARLKIKDLYDAFIVLNSKRAESAKAVLRKFLNRKEEVFLDRVKFLSQVLEKEGFNSFLRKLRIPKKIAANLPKDFPFIVVSELGLKL